MKLKLKSNFWEYEDVHKYRSFIVNYCIIVYIYAAVNTLAGWLGFLSVFNIIFSVFLVLFNTLLLFTYYRSLNKK